MKSLFNFIFLLLLITTNVFASSTIVNRAIEGTVLIKSGNSEGAGAIINSSGFIITCNHVIKDKSDIQIELNNKKKIKATLIESDKNRDIALLKIELNNLPALRIGDSDNSIKVGDNVFAIGSPFGLRNSITKGIVSNLSTKINKFKFIQTDAKVNPGNSGGPLINETGEIIGLINSKISKAEGLSFAVPINSFKDFFTKYNVSLNVSLDNKIFALNNYTNLPNTISTQNYTTNTNKPVVSQKPTLNSSIEKQNKTIIKLISLILIVGLINLFFLILINLKNKRRGSQTFAPVSRRKENYSDVDIELK